MVDYIVLAVVSLIVLVAGIYVYRAKKKGQKCIGCPGGSCQECNGQCKSQK